MKTLSITRDGTEVTVLGGIGDTVRVWIGNENTDVVGTANDWSRDDVVRVAEWLEAWLFGRGLTVRHICKHQHAHATPYEMQLCNEAWDHIEAARAWGEGHAKMEEQYRTQLVELKGHIRAIVQGVQP